MSKQRLIDADALKEATEAHGEKIAYVVSFLWDVDAAPTIDAIPMDWLDEQIHGYASRLQSTELKALLIVKRLWEKDQEGKL